MLELVACEHGSHERGIETTEVWERLVSHIKPKPLGLKSIAYLLTLYVQSLHNRHQISQSITDCYIVGLIFLKANSFFKYGNNDPIICCSPNTHQFLASRLLLLFEMFSFPSLPVEILESFKIHAKCNPFQVSFPYHKIRWMSFPFAVPIASSPSTVLLLITVLVIFLIFK